MGVLDSYKTLQLNHIYCEDCFDTIKRIKKSDYKINNIITSPFYNTGRSSKCHTTEKSRQNHEGRYDIHLDDMTNDEYIDFTIHLFNDFDEIVEKNGCILYNMSYGSENTEIMWLVVAEFKTFTANKKIKSISKKGQKYYENVFNFIEAKNNDGSCKLNKATFSTDLITQLLDIYVAENSIVYDPFSGTGTTANACILHNINYIGSEISQAQVEYANQRLKQTMEELNG